MDFLYLMFYGCLNPRFLDVETNPDHLTVASSQYDILLCSETLVSDMGHVSEVLIPGFCRPVLLCRGKMPRARGMDVYVRDFANPNLSAVIAKCLFLGFVV